MSMNGKLVRIPSDLMERIEEREVAEQLMLEEGLFLGKAWQSLHWVLAGGDSFGLSGVLGGVALMNVNTGAAPPPQLVKPDEVASYARDLELMTEERVREVFDVEGMADDDVWPSNPDLEEIVELAAQVRTYYASAAAAGCGMLQVVS